MRWSEQINEIAAALAQAQGDIKNAIMDSQNPHLKNKYANLASVTDAIKSALSRNGIGYVQNPHMNFADGLVGVNVLLMHKSGQFMEFDPLWCKPARGFAPQEIGSVMTYLRRYTLSSAVGVTQGADADDDGERGEGRVYRQNESDHKKENFRVAPKEPEAKKEEPKPKNEPQEKKRPINTDPNHQQRVQTMLTTSAAIGLTQAMIEKELNASVDTFDDDLFAQAQALYKRIKKEQAAKAQAEIQNG